MNKLDLVISFDDTGSMSSVRKQVRMKIAKLVNDIFMENLDLQVGIIIHNDYCDRDTIQMMDLTSDRDEIVKFVNRSSSCGGGDSDECYELVLNHFHSKFKWRDGKRIAILIGDANPHPVGYSCGGHRNTLDWRKEAATCAENGVNVYSVHALGNSRSRPFYEGVAQLSNGVKITLDQFAHINEYISAIVYGENDQLENYENSNPVFKTNTSFKNMFNKLKAKFGGVIDESPTVSFGGATGVSLSKFQVMEVAENCSIKDFVNMSGARFQVGKGYYELTKSELVQKHKEVIMQHKTTGEVIGDTHKCREMLGLPYGVEGKISPRGMKVAKEYDIFIQSTSYTRKLIGGTRFLYEMEMED